MSDDLAKRLRDAAYRAKREYPEVFRVSEEIAYEAADRIEKLEAALEDALQYVSRADWHYLKDETRKALEGKDG